jgi:hypothetical protein
MRRFFRVFSIVGILILTAGAAGCQSGPIQAASTVAPVISHRYLVHLPGMAGWIDADTTLVQGLGDGNVADHLEIYDWTHPNWMIGAVRAYAHNRAEAHKIADGIAAKLREQPDAQIVLTSWSAGGAVTIWALEDLPEGVQVQSALLVEPAVDPDHDLTMALRHIRGHLFVTHSGGDFFMLGIGTILVGTSDDGVHTVAAGDGGFRKPPNADEGQYRKLVEIPYRSDWIKYGDYGGHAGPLGRKFAKEILGPILASDAEGREPH